MLAEVIRLASDEAKGSHARYLEMYKLIQDRDEELGAAFNEMKRSAAFLRLVNMRSLGLMTDEEFAGFSAQTQAVVTMFLQA